MISIPLLDKLKINNIPPIVARVRVRCLAVAHRRQRRTPRHLPAAAVQPVRHDVDTLDSAISFLFLTSPRYSTKKVAGYTFFASLEYPYQTKPIPTFTTKHSSPPRSTDFTFFPFRFVRECVVTPLMLGRGTAVSRLVEAVLRHIGEEMHHRASQVVKGTRGREGGRGLCVFL